MGINMQMILLGGLVGQVKWIFRIYCHDVALVCHKYTCMFILFCRWLFAHDLVVVFLYSEFTHEIFMAAAKQSTT